MHASANCRNLQMNLVREQAHLLTFGVKASQARPGNIRLCNCAKKRENDLTKLAAAAATAVIEK